MKKLFLLSIIGLLLSCSSDNDRQSVVACKVNSIHIRTLSFDDIEASEFAVNPSFSQKLRFEYDQQNRIVKVNGGFLKLPPGQNSYGYVLDDAPYDTIIYGNGKITIQYSANFPKSRPKKEFVLNTDGTLQSVKVFTFFGVSVYETFYTYEYSDGLVTEKLNGNTFRKLYFTNGNLSKVEKDYTNQAGIIYRKEELTFTNYDQSQNMLKGKFFINGNFLKAFSKNNYRKVSYKNYILYEGNYIINGESYFELPFGYDSTGFADLFEYENCN